MTNSLILRPHRAEAQLRQELAHYVGDVNAVVKLTQLAMDEVGSLHHQAMKQVISSLQRTERKLRAAEARGQLTLAQRQEIHYLTLRYLDEITRIVDEAGMDIIYLVGRASRPALADKRR